MNKTEILAELLHHAAHIASSSFSDQMRFEFRVVHNARDDRAWKSLIGRVS
jgi:hypothetical protein